MAMMIILLRMWWYEEEVEEEEDDDDDDDGNHCADNDQKNSLSFLSLNYVASESALTISNVFDLIAKRDILGFEKTKTNSLDKIWYTRIYQDI